MKDIDKAKELSSKWWQDLIKKENCNSTEEAIELACLEMAKWKEKKVIRKGVKWIKNNFSYNGYGSTLYYSGIDYSPKQIANDFKQSIPE